MKNVETETGYIGPYLERGGLGVRSIAEELVRAPEAPLSDYDKDQVRLFANETVHCMAVVTPTGEQKTLETIIEERSMLMGGMIFPAAFIGDNAISTAETLGVDIPQLDTEQAVYVWLVTAAKHHTYDETTFRKLSKMGLDRYKAHVAQSLIDGLPLDNNELEMMTINFDPKKAIQHAGQLWVARSQLLALRHSLRASKLDIDEAKNAVVEIYLAKLNVSIVEAIDSLLTVYDQSKLIGDTENTAESKRLLGGFGCIVDDTKLRKGALARLDYIRNGMGIDADGHAGAVSAELRAVTSSSFEVSEHGGCFSPEEIKVLMNTPISPDRMRAGFENILRQTDVLSSESSDTWTLSRNTRANDNKFQVVTHPTSTSFSVDGISGTYRVPSAPRSLYDVLVVGGFHELHHVDQYLSDDEFSKLFKIGTLKGKRIGILREPAANASQRRAERRLFGRSKPIANPTYLRALETLRQGGSLADAAREFMQAKLAGEPDTTRRKAATEAADRVLRLMRFHGYNSQPLVYAEEGVMAKDLEGASEEVIKRAGAITAIDLVDQRRLHRYGLLPPVHAIQHDWAGLVIQEFEADIAAALRTARVVGEPAVDTL